MKKGKTELQLVNLNTISKTILKIENKYNASCSFQSYTWNGVKTTDKVKVEQYFWVSATWIRRYLQLNLVLKDKTIFKINRKSAAVMSWLLQLTNTFAHLPNAKIITVVSSKNSICYLLWQTAWSWQLSAPFNWSTFNQLDSRNDSRLFLRCQCMPSKGHTISSAYSWTN